MSLVEKAKIIKVVGRLKTFRGQGLRLDGHIEDRGPVPLIVWRNEFPCGIIDPYLIDGPEVDVLVDKLFVSISFYLTFFKLILTKSF